MSPAASAWRETIKEELTRYPHNDVAEVIRYTATNGRITKTQKHHHKLTVRETAKHKLEALPHRGQLVLHIRGSF